MELLIQSRATLVVAIANKAESFGLADDQAGMLAPGECPGQSRRPRTADGQRQQRILNAFVGEIHGPANPAVNDIASLQSRVAADRASRTRISAKPNIAGSEVAVVGVRVAESRQRRERTFIQHLLPAAQIGMQAQLVVELDDLLVLDPRVVAVLVILFVSVGDQGAQGVMAATELQDDHDPLIRLSVWPSQSGTDEKIRQHTADPDNPQTLSQDVPPSRNPCLRHDQTP